MYRRHNLTPERQAFFDNRAKKQEEALARSCPYCSAEAGQRCTSAVTSRPTATMHADRFRETK